MAARKKAKSAKVVQKPIVPIEVILVLSVTALIIGFVVMMMAV